MSTEPTDSIGSADSGDQLNTGDAAGDAVSGVSGSEDGAPTPTGSIPPGPADPDSDDLTDPADLPPLGERMF